jgi:hypothetical protein
VKRGVFGWKGEDGSLAGIVKPTYQRSTKKRDAGKGEVGNGGGKEGGACRYTERDKPLSLPDSWHCAFFMRKVVK